MTETKESKAMQVANWLTEKAVGGVGPLSSAEDLALEYLNNPDYEDNDACVESLINWETTKNFSTGFITGLHCRLRSRPLWAHRGFCKREWLRLLQEFMVMILKKTKSKL